jgi:hypothetical protein
VDEDAVDFGTVSEVDNDALEPDAETLFVALLPTAAAAAAVTLLKSLMAADVERVEDDDDEGPDVRLRAPPLTLPPPTATGNDVVLPVLEVACIRLLLVGVVMATVTEGSMDPNKSTHGELELCRVDCRVF